MKNNKCPIIESGLKAQSFHPCRKSNGIFLYGLNASIYPSHNERKSLSEE